ncbi:CLCF1 factor, partial [Atractosteus spatula]|nr:CLCF1 factor [Atractosteus spatula]
MFPCQKDQSGQVRTGPPLSSPPLGLNDFSRKVESFWVLRELQSWLWRSAKDFNRLKKRLRA